MAISYMKHRKIPQWKIEEVEYLAKMFKEYPVFLIADLQGYPANQLQRLRKKLSKHMLFKVSKNKLILLALKKAGFDTTGFEQYLTGQNLLIFSKVNAFEAANLLEQHREYTYYKPGEIADKEIVIPEGNTGIPPGPMLSVFGKLKIPTRVEGNAIVVVKDTVVAKPGDVISAELASLLQKLNLPLKEVVLKIKFAYDGGVIIPGDRLKLDLNEYISMLTTAHREALALGVEIALPIPEILELTIAKAYRQARTLAIEAGYITDETIKDILVNAYMKAYVLALEIQKHGVDLGVEAKIVTTAQPTEEKPKEEEKKEVVEEERRETISEEELAEGLSALFG